MNDAEHAHLLPEPGQRHRKLQDLILLAIAGVFVVTATELSLLSAPRTWSPGFIGFMVLGFAANFSFRALRRKLVMGRSLSIHMALSFEAVFQGATLLNPQIAHPAAEHEFLRRHLDLSSEAVAPWFRVRPTSAAAVPLGLGAVVLFLAGGFAASAIVLIAAFTVVTAAARRHDSFLATRPVFAVAIVLGMAGAVFEGLCVVRAAHIIQPDVEAWQILFAYLIVLSAFELTPMPLAVGTLELVALAAWWLIPDVPFVLLPFAYRLWRGLPLTLLTLFYLPRYKLSLLNLYDPLLPLAIAHTRRPEGGWHPRETDDETPRLSIVIPAYNEEDRLPGYLPDVIAFADALEGDAEILVVDDGSTDGTADYVDKTAKDHSCVRLISLPRNEGKGMAVRHGVENAVGQYVLFADADGATPIAEAATLLELADEDFEVIIGSRRLSGSMVERGAWRDMLGAVFCRMTNILAVPAVSDTQCGFKLFQRAAAKRIFPLAREKGWAFDVEILFLAQKFGFAIAEVPVAWSAKEGSKIKPLPDSLRMFAALLRIRQRHAGLTESLQT